MNELLYVIGDLVDGWVGGWVVYLRVRYCLIRQQLLLQDWGERRGERIKEGGEIGRSDGLWGRDGENAGAREEEGFLFGEVGGWVGGWFG